MQNPNRMNDHDYAIILYIEKRFCTLAIPKPLQCPQQPPHSPSPKPPLHLTGCPTVEA